MLRPDRGQAYQPHAVVLGQRRGEVVAAVNRDLVPHLDQPFSHLFIISFDPAVFRDHSPPTDKPYPQPPFLERRNLLNRRRKRRTWYLRRLPRSQPFIQTQQLLIMSLRRVTPPHRLPTSAPHFLRQLRHRP